MQASGGGNSAEFFERVFLANFTCRLILFRFADSRKDPTNVNILASADFRPTFGDGASATPFTVDRFLGSTTPGANFPIGNGLGVAIVVEKNSPGALTVQRRDTAFVRIHSVTLDFQARPRDESVTV